MIDLGRKYGVSRETIKWACELLNVPLPPQAYFVHLRAGRPRTRVELPPLRRGQPKAIGLKDLTAREAPSRRRKLQRAKAKRQGSKVRSSVEAQFRYDFLLMEVEDWRRAESIRAYLAELDRRRDAGGRPAQDFDEWCAWAVEVANTLDLSDLHVGIPEE